MDTQSLIDALRRHFDSMQSEDIVCAYLFGSVARGIGHSGSDVDIAVLYEEKPPETLEGSGIPLAAAGMESESMVDLDLVLGSG